MTNSTKAILVGTCGFNRSQRATFSNLDVLELQQTFYDPPSLDWLRNLRSKAPENFVFTVKAWMLITHKYNKNLWKRIKREISGDLNNYGFFQNTEEVYWAWRETLKAAIAVKAAIIVFQSPSSFRPNKENIESLTSFINQARKEAHPIKLAWEPRGEWWNNLELLDKLSRELDLIIIGDYLRGRIPRHHAYKIAYTRLHGLGGNEVNYKYKYSGEDLLELKKIIDSLQVDTVYVLFNNIFSFENAVQFKKLIGSK